MFKVYVDGQHGTTGLLVNQRLEKHPEVEILEIPYEDRHNKQIREELLNSADVVFLCLPDDAAIEAATLVTNPKTKIIDASTAHRTNDQWAYGFSELSPQHLKKLHKSFRVSNPGCHATATISVLYPLIQSGVMKDDLQLTVFSITGYSGGGKKMIHTYEHTDSIAYKAPRQYALNMNHKHVPEIMKQSGLLKKPLFMPIVSDYARGLAVTIAFAVEQLNRSLSKEDISDLLYDHYKDTRFVRVHRADAVDSLVDGCIDIQENNDTNYLDIFIYGNEDQIQIIAKLDNLGKGASGAAIQNMNIMMGLDEACGL